MKTLSGLAKTVLQHLADSQRKRIGCDALGLADDHELAELRARFGAPRHDLIAAIDELWVNGFLQIAHAPIIPGIRPTGWLVLDPCYQIRP